jgi:hypothetical protein
MPDPRTATASTQRPLELSKERVPVSSMSGLYAAPPIREGEPGVHEPAPAAIGTLPGG